LKLLTKKVSNIGTMEGDCVSFYGSMGIAFILIIRRLIAHGCDSTKLRQQDVIAALFFEGNHFAIPPPTERFIMESCFRTLVELKFPICLEDCAVIPHGLFYESREARDAFNATARCKEMDL
jgi:hypothetical protein